MGVVRWHESLPEAGTEATVADGAADLQQEISTPPAPTHLLRLVHPAVHQEIRRPLGDGCANPQSGTATLNVLQSSTLATSGGDRRWIGTLQAATSISSATKQDCARMSPPPIRRTCPFRTIAITS
jgi:hypothetical protein